MATLGKWVAKLFVEWVAKMGRWLAKLGRWVATLQMEMGAKLQMEMSGKVGGDGWLSWWR